MDMVLIHRETGIRGAQGEQRLQKWVAETMDLHWEETYQSPYGTAPAQSAPYQRPRRKKDHLWPGVMEETRGPDRI